MTGLLDVHAHFVTDSYVAAALAAGHASPDGLPGWPDWSAAEHLRLMDGWGVQTAVLSISSPAVRARTREVNIAGGGIRQAPRPVRALRRPASARRGRLAGRAGVRPRRAGQRRRRRQDARARRLPRRSPVRAGVGRAGRPPRSGVRPPRLAARCRAGGLRSAPSDAGVPVRLHPRRRRPGVLRRAAALPAPRVDLHPRRRPAAARRPHGALPPRAAGLRPGRADGAGAGRALEVRHGRHAVPRQVPAFVSDRPLYVSDHCWPPWGSSHRRWRARTCSAVCWDGAPCASSRWQR